MPNAAYYPNFCKFSLKELEGRMEEYNKLHQINPS